MRPCGNWVFRERSRIGWPSYGVACEHVCEERRPFWRELADLREKARRALEPDAGSKFEEKDTKGIDIRGGRRQFAADAFGSEGIWRAEIHGEGRCRKREPGAELGIEDARDAEVGEDGVSVWFE